MVPLLKDARTAARVLRNLARARQQRNIVARLSAGRSVPAPGSIQIAVYFADGPVNLYQVRQWFAPLKGISARWPAAIISRSPGATLALWDESPIPVVHLRKISELEHFVHTQDIRIVFYVNQNAKNFQMFRYARMWHVFVNHGESDKMYMATNQYKAYDYSLVAGQAAIDRLRRRLWDFDFEKKIITIGRPQADHFAGALPYPPDGRTVVLYAPTWEGDRDSAAYGSIASHGLALTSALLASGEHRLIYRPHPRSGVLDPAYRAANREIVEAIERANAADPSAQHVYDDRPELGWQLSAADVAITDISAMVYDRLAVGKPLLVTRPVAPHADIDETGYLGACEWLPATDAPGILAAVERVQFDVEARARLETWVERYFGDTTPGAATARFTAAIEQLMGEWERHAELHAADNWVEDDDPDWDDDGEEGQPD